jgi:type IV pilus assembly protein PilY1
MKARALSVCNGILAFAMTFMAGMSAHADDTEIFFGSSVGSKPNVLFILDTSGSMSGKDGGDTSRMDRMKSAFNSLMDNINNANVGLMRFNDPGGPVLYPVSNIDAPVSSITTVVGTLSASSDDAEQAASGTVTLTNQTLAMTTRSTSPGATRTVRVNATNRDAEERISSGTISDTNAALDLNFDGSNANIVGTLFPSVNIPKNAIILDAYVTFTVFSETGTARSSPLNIEIRGQTGGTVSNFSTTSGNLSSRTKTTTATLWNITDPTPPVNETLNTPNIAPVIQELVNQGTWTNTSNVALFMRRPSGDTTTGVRSFYSYNQSTTRAPLLTVVYEVPATATTQTVGLRYTDIGIPRGAKITTASLEFVSANDSSSAATYNIRAHDIGNSPALTTASNNLSSRAQTAATVSWTPDPWIANENYSTLDNGADLADVIQAVVNRSDWCGGNAMTLLIQGSGTRLAKSYDSSPSDAPKLRISYDPTEIASGGGCINGSASYRVGNANDDASVNIYSNSQSLTSSTLYLGNDTNSNSANALGIRFSNIQVPKNANIVSAYLEFTARSNDSNSIPLNIRMQLADNPVEFSDNNKVTNAARSYSSTVAWTPSSWTAEVTYLSADLATLVQQIVNRSGWDKGNAMVFELRRSGSATAMRRAYSYDSSTTKAPRLIINYTTNVSAASAQTTRHLLKSLVNDMVPAGYTPIVDMLYEAALYYRGGNVYWGKIRGDASTMRSSINDRRYFRLSHPDSYTGGTEVLPSGCDPSNLNSTNCVNSYIDGNPVYKSPIDNECQSNHIVFLTDGAPTQNRSAALIRTMTGKSTCAQSGYSACANEIAEFLSSVDQSPLPGDTQKVLTHTIAFNLDDSSGFLSGIATAGKGAAKSASSAEELLTTFKEIFASIAEPTDTTFVSPGVTVNAFNRLTHRDEIYFALFRPEKTPSWPGNLKRYRIDYTGTIFGVDGQDAIDDSRGFFKESAKSWWSSDNDGNSAEAGGAADRLTNYTTRKVYTYYSGSPSTNLANAANAFVASNTNITKSMLGIELATDEMRTNLIEWARGRDAKDVNGNGSTTDERKRMSDPLHSVPHLVTYGGTDEDPDITIFYGDNEGFLHAIDGKTGDAHFSFIPEELLPNLIKVYDNSAATKHPYGLDAPPNAWVKDVNNDLIVTPSDGDKVYVYIGMGRGGRNYYAIDATDRSSPKILWTIRGGNGDFSELGQTWARPIKTQINVNGTVTDVLIVSGGYDTNQDNVDVRTTDSMGRAIFIVNAVTGQKIWSAGPSASHNLQLTEMLYSIPSTIRAVDINNDKLVDQLYVGDMGGQLWRFDINNGSAVASLATGAVIADIAGNTKASARRFYHEPDVSVVIENNVRKLAVAIGSGYRGHPLNDVIEDRFYLFKLNDVGGPPLDGPDTGTYPDYVKMTEASLYDATENLIGQGSDEEKQTAIDALKAASGWFIQMENEGEKVLSSATTFAGEVFFTTYSPRGSETGCSLGNGTSRRYRVNVVDATPARNAEDMQDGTTLTKDDRSEELLTTGIAADPQILRLEGGNVVCVGTECEALGSTDAITKTYWYSE